MPDNFQYEEENKDLNEFDPNSQANKLSRGQKFAVVGLALFAILVIIMWGAQFKRSINEPLAYKDNTGSENAVCLGPDCQESSDTALQNKDTDSDGLTDWDELNIYNTSPYLEDSDSDGFTDKQEIDSDNDPNCPIGRDCSSAPLSASESDNTIEDNSALNSLLEQFGPEEGSSTEPVSADLESLFGSDVDIAALRQLLIEQGMDKEILDQISDEQLRESLTEVLQE